MRKPGGRLRRRRTRDAWLLGLVFGLAAACGQGDERAAELVEPAPGFALRDQAGQPRSLAELRGRAVLLDFVYTSCPGPCPMRTALHARVQRSLPEALRERVWFVSISIDPERDTPEALRAYAQARGADLSNWSFLTGPRATLEEVARGYAVALGLEPREGEIAHVPASFLIDGEGQLVRRYVGSDLDAEALARDLAALAARAG